MQYALPGSAILLIEDAVYAANDRSEFSARLNALNDVRVFALEPDMRARGVSERDGISLVDYAGFVELAVTYDKVQSWL